MHELAWARRAVVALLFGFGLWSLLASSSYDGDDDDVDLPDLPLNFVLGAMAAPLTIDTGERIITVNELRLAGNFNIDRNARLRLKSDFVDLDPTSMMTLEVTPSDPDDTLRGNVDFTVNESLDFGVDHDPITGRFSAFAAGMTVIAVPAGGGVDVTVGLDPVVRYGWNDFEDLPNDDNNALALRLTALAYRQLREALLLTYAVELLQIDIDSNDDELESIGFDTGNAGLELGCNNLTTDDAGEYRVFWRVDAPGTGQGVAGSGDEFEGRYGNCLVPGQSRYLDGEIELNGYTKTNSDTVRVLNYTTAFANVFYATEQVSSTLTSPAENSPRVGGQLLIDYVLNIPQG